MAGFAGAAMGTAGTGAGAGAGLVANSPTGIGVAVGTLVLAWSGRGIAIGGEAGFAGSADSGCLLATSEGAPTLGTPVAGGGSLLEAAEGATAESFSDTSPGRVKNQTATAASKTRK